jgi:SAM-dependent methyltransferase
MIPASRFVRVAGVLGLAALAFLLLWPTRTADNRVVLGPKTPTVAGPAEEVTLRNVVKTDLSYTIEPNAYTRAPRVRTLGPGGLDRIATDVPLEITFDNGSRRGSYTVFPGRPYSFRYDENGLVRVYPGSHGREDAADLAPYVPTPQPVVERMLEVAGVTAKDVVYDIGCGDGRMVITAAKRFGATGVGIDIDAKLIAECRANAAREGVEKKVRFICADATKAHITGATVLALYLLPESLEALKPLFEKELAPGARIVSHNYRIPGWDGRIARLEKVPAENDRSHRILLYVMPAKSSPGEKSGGGPSK